MATLIRLSLIAVLVYTASCSWLYLGQDALLYYPTPESTRSDADALRLSHDDETLKVWKAGDGEAAVIYFGGNAEDVGFNIPSFTRDIPDATHYFVNYRGYGGSTGSPEEAANYRDAAYVFDYVSERHEQVSVIGRSLGSGIAVWLAAERPVARLVLITPFDSIEAVARNAYPWVPVSLLLKDKYRAVDRVPDVEAPVLILVAEADSIIPQERSVALARAFDESQACLQVIRNAGHNTIGRSRDYLRLIGDFLAQDAPTHAASARPGSWQCAAEDSVS
ncbi:MAG: alpha/beta fold hydrolase [Woeseia sp.]